MLILVMTKISIDLVVTKITIDLVVTKISIDLVVTKIIDLLEGHPLAPPERRYTACTVPIGDSVIQWKGQ